MTARRPVSTGTAEHYVWGSACDGWRLLDEADLSNVIEERVLVPTRTDTIAFVWYGKERA